LLLKCAKSVASGIIDTLKAGGCPGTGCLAQNWDAFTSSALGGCLWSSNWSDCESALPYALGFVATDGLGDVAVAGLPDLVEATDEAVDAIEGLSDSCKVGQSFSAGTQVLLASGAAVAIDSLRPGDKVLATNTKTGKTTAETVTAVMVHHDTDLYNLTVRSGGRTEVIHTTTNHLFWALSLKQWVRASDLKEGEHLKTPDGRSAVVVGGSVPAVHDGWMWDLTVPGNEDHDFYVLAAVTGSARTGNIAADGVPVLVHNCGTGARFEVDSQGTATDLTEGDPNILDRNPLEGTTYTDKVLAQIESGDNHGFPAGIDTLPTMEDTSIVPGGDRTSGPASHHRAAGR
jgi:hypothetical protein